MTKMRLPHIYTGHPTSLRVSIPGSLECPCSTQRRPSLTGAFLHIEPRIPPASYGCTTITSIPHRHKVLPDIKKHKHISDDRSVSFIFVSCLVVENFRFRFGSVKKDIIIIRPINQFSPRSHKHTHACCIFLWRTEPAWPRVPEHRNRNANNSGELFLSCSKSKMCR